MSRVRKLDWDKVNKDLNSRETNVVLPTGDRNENTNLSSRQGPGPTGVSGR